MKNINLKNNDLLKRRSDGRRLSLILSIILIVISLFLYGVSFGLAFFTKSNNEQIETEINSIEKYLENEKFAELFDFSMRLSDLKVQVSQQGLLAQTENIINFSNNTLSLVRFVDFKFEEGANSCKYEITAEFPDYITLIKQIKAYRQMDNLNDFLLNSVKTVESEDGSEVLIVDFEIDMGAINKIITTSNNQEENF